MVKISSTKKLWRGRSVKSNNKDGSSVARSFSSSKKSIKQQKKGASQLTVGEAMDALAQESQQQQPEARSEVQQKLQPEPQQERDQSQPQPQPQSSPEVQAQIKSPPVSPRSEKRDEIVVAPEATKRGRSTKTLKKLGLFKQSQQSKKNDKKKQDMDAKVNAVVPPPKDDMCMKDTQCTESRDQREAELQNDCDKSQTSNSTATGEKPYVSLRGQLEDKRETDGVQLNKVETVPSPEAKVAEIDIAPEAKYDMLPELGVLCSPKMFEPITNLFDHQLVTNNIFTSSCSDAVELVALGARRIKTDMEIKAQAWETEAMEINLKVEAEKNQLLSEEIGQLKEDIVKARAAEQEMNEAEKNIKTLSDELNALENKLEAESQQNATLKSQMSQLKTESTTTKTDAQTMIDSQNKEISKLENVVGALKADMERKRAAEAEAVAENEITLQKKVAVLLKEIALLKGRRSMSPKFLDRSRRSMSPKSFGGRRSMTPKSMDGRRSVSPEALDVSRSKSPRDLDGKHSVSPKTVESSTSSKDEGKDVASVDGDFEDDTTAGGDTLTAGDSLTACTTGSSYSEMSKGQNVGWFTSWMTGAAAAAKEEQRTRRNHQERIVDAIVKKELSEINQSKERLYSKKESGVSEGSMEMEDKDESFHDRDDETGEGIVGSPTDCDSLEEFKLETLHEVTSSVTENTFMSEKDSINDGTYSSEADEGVVTSDGGYSWLLKLV